MPETSYRESHLRKGVEYHNSFTSRPHLAMIWNLERRLLRQIVREHFPTERPTYLDFACGTGGVMGCLAPLMESSTGVDVSASMLKVARDSLNDVDLVQADITKNDVLGDLRFDLITAFRFFPNAEPELRRDSLEALLRHLNPDGILVFNDHRNRGSLLRRVIGIKARVLSHGSQSPKEGMSRQEVYDLVASAGLLVEREYPLGVLPLSDHHMWPPLRLVETLELALGRVGHLLLWHRISFT